MCISVYVGQCSDVQQLERWPCFWRVCEVLPGIGSEREGGKRERERERERERM